jgi:hypothetical protein
MSKISQNKFGLRHAPVHHALAHGIRAAQRHFHCSRNTARLSGAPCARPWQARAVDDTAADFVSYAGAQFSRRLRQYVS